MDFALLDQIKETLSFIKRYEPTANMKGCGTNQVKDETFYGYNGAVVCYNPQRTISTVSHLHQLTYQAEFEIQALLYFMEYQKITLKKPITQLKDS